MGTRPWVWIAASSTALILLTWPTLPAAQDEPLTQAEYVAAVSLGTEYWYPLYSEFGARGRYSRILTKCGYKKEADELDSATEALVRKKLEQLAQGRIDGLRRVELHGGVGLGWIHAGQPGEARVFG